MELVVTTGAISCAKLQSNHHHQQTNTQFFTGQMPFLSPNQQCQSTEGKNITSHGLGVIKELLLKELLSIAHFIPSSPGVFQLCLWPLIATGYLGGGLPCLSSAMSGEWKRICLCFVMKVGLDFTPRWCSSDDNKTSQRQVLRAQVASVALFYQGQHCQSMWV